MAKVSLNRAQELLLLGRGLDDRGLDAVQLRRLGRFPPRAIPIQLIPLSPSSAARGKASPRSIALHPRTFP